MQQFISTKNVLALFFLDRINFKLIYFMQKTFIFFHICLIIYKVISLMTSLLHKNYYNAQNLCYMLPLKY